MVSIGEWESGRLGDWKAGSLRGRESGRLGGRESGRLGDRESGDRAGMLWMEHKWKLLQCDVVVHITAI